MKKSILSRALVCGILATSFVLINCQKAPDRKVKPEVGDQNAKQSAQALPACSADVLTLIDARTNLMKSIDDVIKLNPRDQKSTMSDADKKTLNDNFNQFNAKSNELFQKIRSIPPADPKAQAPVDGCKQTDPKIAGASKDIKIADMQLEVKSRASDVQRITGIPNEFSRQIIPGRAFLMSADLAALLSDEKNFNGEKAISEGKILDKAAYDAMKADKTKTSCVIVSTDNKPFAEKAEISLLDAKASRANATDPMIAEVHMSVKADASADSADAGSRLISLSCKLADSNMVSDDLNLTATFGDLLALKLDSTPPAPAPEQPAPNSDDSAPAPAPGDSQPAPAPAPGDSQPAPAPAPGDSQPAPAPAPDPATPQGQVTMQHAAEDAAALKAIENRLNQ